MAGIFINYRRDDTAGQAGRLYDELRSQFGSDQVFIDVNQIAPGADFVETVNQALTTTKVVLVLIGRQWLTVTDRRQRRRLDSASDYVRVEIASSLTHRGMRVIPVLLQGADMPDDEDLPDDLKPLSRRNALEIRDARWGDDVALLVRTLRQAITATGTEPVQPRIGPPADPPGAGRSSPSSVGVIEPSRAMASPSTPGGEGRGGRPQSEAGAVPASSGVGVGDKIGSPSPVFDARGSPAVRYEWKVESDKRAPYSAPGLGNRAIAILVIGVIIFLVAVALYANSASSLGQLMTWPTATVPSKPAEPAKPAGPMPTAAPAKPTEAPKPAAPTGR